MFRSVRDDFFSSSALCSGRNFVFGSAVESRMRFRGTVNDVHPFERLAYRVHVVDRSNQRAERVRRERGAESLYQLW
jgi:hypothetical protein